MSVTILLCPDSGLSSNEPSDAELTLLAAAMTDMINHDLGPDYGQNWQGHYTVRAHPRGLTVPTANARLWLCHLLPNIPFGAYGYHTLDPNNCPVLYVDVIKTLAHGLPLSLEVSHEINEAIVNPQVDGGILAMYGTQQGFYYKECCDPCAGQPGYWYRYKGVDYAMANYVLPRYWDPRAAGGVFDRGGYVHKALTPAPGGSQTIYLVAGTVTADGAAPAALAPATVQLGAPLVA